MAVAAGCGGRPRGGGDNYGAECWRLVRPRGKLKSEGVRGWPSSRNQCSAKGASIPSDAVILGVPV
ncbi:hypothetical protein CFC21_100923 [Triticum aestivum]|uniref:Uncharacterized protein n=4 Tax=Triticum TaxID=4564 RepID=A0A9R1M240_WHEAT|nr:hypothetical protein TRIUR3_19374 [Triticum urartu]KAF7099266.1 hypothetical protein CFC21_100919 [Triticum aestivum]KAF7099271.1 hypothetical protein CFC21_100923 [Triticum aestivum]